MKSHLTSQFRQRFRELPPDIQKQARKAYRFFLDDPYYPSLHFKQVHASHPFYSARVGSAYRVLGIREGDVITWFWIGSHSEYDRLLSQL